MSGDPHTDAGTSSAPEPAPPTTIVVDTRIPDLAGATVESLLAGAPVKGVPVITTTLTPHITPRVGDQDVDGAPAKRSAPE